MPPLAQCKVKGRFQQEDVHFRSSTSSFPLQSVLPFSLSFLKMLAPVAALGLLLSLPVALAASTSVNVTTCNGQQYMYEELGGYG